MVNIADDVVVPMTTLEVIDGLRKSKLSTQSLVWRIGMHDWTRVADVPQLRLAVDSTRGATPEGVRPPAAPGSGTPQAPFPAQTQTQRARNTLPLGFPGLEARGGVRKPAPITPLAGRDEPLAVYDRPNASLTFSASGRADWQGRVDSARLAPVPAVAAALPVTRPPTPSLPNSLAPTTADAAAEDRARAPGAWGDLDELLSSERRADQRRSRRVVLGASLGSAAVAAIFTLFVIRSPIRHAATPPTRTAQASPMAPPSPVPLPTPTLEAAATPSASVTTAMPAARQVAPQRVAPRLARRPKGTATPARSDEASVDSPATASAPDTAGATPEPAAVSALAPEPAPVVNTAAEAAPTPVAPSAPDGP